MQSFKKKIVSLVTNGIEPLEVGMHNFKHPNKDVEILAKIRSVTCGNCHEYVDEPIDFLRVNDVRIESLSNKMCDECGCTLSYKLRQSITKCKKWSE
jgi:RNase P subunit RPR2